MWWPNNAKAGLMISKNQWVFRGRRYQPDACFACLRWKLADRYPSIIGTTDDDGLVKVYKRWYN